MHYEVLRLNHIGRSINGHIINDISFSLYQKEAFCILTEDIDTKNFLMDLFQGNAQPSQGSLYINDHKKKLTDLSSTRQSGLYVVKDNQLIDSMNVAHNLYMMEDVFYGNWKFLNNHSIHAETERLLREFSLDSIKTTSLIKSLSFVDRYVLAIIRAYTAGAKIIILDTPSFIFYQPSETKRLQKIVGILKERGISVLWFSNKWNPVFQNFDRFAMIKNGVVTQISKLTTIPPVNADQDFMNAQRSRFSLKTNDRKVVLNCKQIVLHKYPEKRISFSLYEGEILGICDAQQILGPYFSQMADGKVPKSDIITLNGRKFNPKPHAKNQIAFILPSENPERIFPQMSLVDNISLLLNKPMYNTFGFLNKRIRDHIARTALESIHADYLLTKYSSKPPLKHMNVYDQFMVEIAKWLCLNPKVFIFSDPTTIYDNLSEEHFIKLLNTLQELGISLLLISSSEENLSKFCTRVIVL